MFTNDLLIIVFNVSAFAASFFLTAVLTQAFIRVSYRLDLLDHPTGRKAHEKPMPFLGGAAVFVGFWAVIFAGLAAAFSSHAGLWAWPEFRVISTGMWRLAPKIAGIFFGGFIVLLVGLLDDKFGWSPAKKLTGQVVAALVLMGSGLTINLLSGLGWLGYLATFLWILLIINAFNFIDSLDGHCAGVALISCVMFFWITQIIDQPMVGIFLITFAGALIGFLPHNFKPARIFLGDNGSLLIGYMMAAFTLLCRYQVPDATTATVFIPVLIFGVPIYDTVSVIAVRLFRGMPPWEGDRNHFAHRLVKMGMSDKAAVVFSYFIAFTIGQIAVLTTQVNSFGALLIGIIFISMIGMIAFMEYYATLRVRIAEELAKQGRRRKEDIRQAEEERLG